MRSHQAISKVGKKMGKVKYHNYMSGAMVPSGNISVAMTIAIIFGIDNLRVDRLLNDIMNKDHNDARALLKKIRTGEYLKETSNEAKIEKNLTMRDMLKITRNYVNEDVENDVSLDSSDVAVANALDVTADYISLEPIADTLAVTADYLSADVTTKVISMLAGEAFKIGGGCESVTSEALKEIILS